MIRCQRFFGSSILAAVVLLALSIQAAAETKRFKPTRGVPTFAVREPVLHVKPGDIVETETLYGGYYAKPRRRMAG